MQIERFKSSVHFKNTHKTAQAIKDMHIQKATNYLKSSSYRSNVCHSVIQLIVVPGQTVGLEEESVAQKRLNFCYTCVKMQSNAELKGLHVDDLVVEHIH